MIDSFYGLYNHLGNDINYRWLTTINSAGNIDYNSDELHKRINDYYQFIYGNKVQADETILIILKEGLDLFASFIAAVISGAVPAYYAYPSPKQSIKQFFSTITDLIEYNDIKMIIGYPEVINILQERDDIKNSILVKNDEVKVIDNNKLSIPKRKETFLQFSSGTTGAKKGIKISSKALFKQIKAYRSHVQYDENSTVVSWLPHYHDMGLIACMLIPLFEKVPVVMLSPFDWVSRPVTLLENIQKYKATHTWQPNFALGHLVKSISSDDSNKYDLSSLKQLICCSEPVMYETVEKFKEHFSPFGLNPDVISNCYAMAENTFAMTVSSKGELKYLLIDYDLMKTENRIQFLENGYKISSAGKPISNTQIKILSGEKIKLPENNIGEIFIKSDCMLDEYHNNKKATEESFFEGWFNTGDLGFIHDGELYITGRKKELIILGGENIYPQDIEQIINNSEYFIPGRNVVFGITDKGRGTEKIIALAEVSIDEYENINILGLKKKIFNQLNISIADIFILPRKTLKKSTAGKISRYLNSQAFTDGFFDKYIGIENKLPIKLNNQTIDIEKIIQEVIPGQNRIIIHNDTLLFESGIIDSFGFVELIQKLESEYGISFPEKFKSYNFFKTILHIKNTIDQVKKGHFDNMPINFKNEHADSLKNLQSQKIIIESQTFLERIINYFPLKKTALYPRLLKVLGMKIGKNVQFSGNVKFKIRGNISNIFIGDNVRIGKHVDIRNREDGQIILNNNCYIDENVRLVAAREGKIDLGEGTEVGSGSVMNSGGILKTGKYCLIAGNVNINSSTHGTDKNSYIKLQDHLHGKIIIGNDVWIGSGSSILMNTNIGDGAIISSNSLVSGVVSDFNIFAGVPATFLRKR
jgi:fatty-acyl-CoA synthase